MALLLWFVAFGTETLRVVIITPWLEGAVPDATLRELLQVPLLSVPYIALPWLLVVRRNGWTAGDLGLVWKPRSRAVAVFAVAFGLLIGCIPFLTGRAVVGVTPLPAGVFVILVYTNAFVEEFYHRGVIQSTLERALGQGRAVIGGGILFGLAHAAFDISTLAAREGPAAVVLAMLLQGMAGSFFGIIYMKTRSLWPGMVCHYLANWLSAMLVTALR